MALVSAAPYLALLSEPDSSLRTYALSSLNDVVDQLWAEIANNIGELEELYEDESFEKRRLAALLISKVYYNLGDFESSVKYSLYAGDEFKIEEQSQYIESIVSQCINVYSSESQRKFESPEVQIDERLTGIFDRMLEKCLKSNELKLALGISLESYRLDSIESILKKQIEESNFDVVLQLINYVLVCAISVITNNRFKTMVLNSLIGLLLSLDKEYQDFFTIFKIIVQLNDSTLAITVFRRLIDNEEDLIAYQGAFDLVNTATQELLDKVIAELTPKFEDHDTINKNILSILSGVPTCDLDITFLFKNNNTDITILNKSKKLVGRKIVDFPFCCYLCQCVYACRYHR
jgi:26S proteasome regulatory subunit N2